MPEDESMSKVVFLTLSCVLLVAALSGRSTAAESSTPQSGSGDDAGFKPLVEAPMPEGFPAYTPVGQIEVKKYPAYRKAETRGRTAFWTLFQHITTSGISMTAPVEMTFQEDGPPVGREQAMAFLYGDQSIGSAGKKGDVEVTDVPPATVVCLGMRGQRNESAVVEAEQRLRKWLDQNKDRYEQCGPVRIMGYNSPFVARDRQFYEVQIPVRELAAKKSA